MTLKIEKAERRPFIVEYVIVHADNMREAAAWCNGNIRTTMRDDEPVKYVAMHVSRPANPRQKMAFAGDYILHTISGFRVYGKEAFLKSFKPLDSDELVETVEEAPKEDSNKPEDYAPLTDPVEKAPDVQFRDGTIGDLKMVES